ncbi:MAG: metal-dependent hydrolase [Thiohalomonadales bacterium]
MPTPIGHAVLGLVIAKSIKPDSERTMAFWLLFSVIAANAADLDFVPGLILGDINLFHQGPSHSIIAALLFGLVSVCVAPLLKESRRKVALLGSVAYLSHLLLDMFGHDAREPIGLPLAWPISDMHWHIFPVLSGVRHGAPGDSLDIFLQEVFSVHNLISVLKEIVIILPIFVIVWYVTLVRKKGTKKRARRLTSFENDKT